MKRYFIYIVMVVAALFVGCTTEDVTDKNPEMVEVGDIEVTFSVGGEEVRSLDLASVSHTITVDVALNNEGIYWNVEANQDWCQIVEEPHRGTGSFTMVINANDTFDAREDATITFKAGAYEVEKLVVSHNGNVFVLDQIYAASTKGANSFATKVKTRDAGEAWSLECDPWITATKVAATTADGYTITDITISWAENSDISRYGEVRLVQNGKDSADACINVWQYGTELNYDAAGNILLAAEDVEPLELRVPKQTVKEIVMPSWVTYTVVENADNSVSYMLQFAGNPSDAQHIRTTELELTLLSGGANIKLPVIKQEYYNMEGLLTGPGLMLFAKTWNEGGDVSQWYVDGVPTIVADVDMTEVNEWTPIGTNERPWTGEFNGKNHKIINLRSSQPLFGVVDNATLKNIVIDETSVFERVGQFADDIYLASLAAEIRNNTVVEYCTNNAKVSIDAIASADNKSIFVAGMVAKVDATSKLTLCSNIGAINVPSSCTVSGNETLCKVGGLVAHNDGIVEDSFNNGPIVAGVQALHSYTAGVVAYNANGAIVRNSQNAAAITFNAQRGSAGTYEAQVAGVVAFGSGEVYGNTNEGDIALKSNVDKLYVGGVAALLPAENTKFEANLQGNASDILSEGEARYAYFGGLAGYVQVTEFAIDYAKDGSNAAGTINVTNGVSDLTNAILCMGGHFGLIDGDITFNAPMWEGTIGSKFVDVDNYCPTKAGGIVAQVNGIVNITGATVAGSISTAHRWNTKTSKQVNHSLGGIVGECNDAVTIKNSNNAAAITWDRASSSNRVQYSSVAIGGIAGRILGGNALIENCNSNAHFYNGSYNNASYDATAKPNCTGGIVGSFGLSANTISETLTVRNCTNQGKLRALRGYVAGIVGWAQNATIEECNYTVGAFEQDINPHAAGIIAGAYTSTNVKNCTAIVDINCGTGGSCTARAAGIVAISSGTTLIEGCSYFGTITYNYNKDVSTNEYYGGIVGYGDAQTKVKGCRYGGVVDGVTISANNVLAYATGVDHHNGDKCAAVVEGIEYWSGK